VGCAEVGGDKAQWISDLFASIEARPRIHNFIWFDISKETDWRIDSSAAALSAFHTGLKAGDSLREVFCYRGVPASATAQSQPEVSISILLGRPVRVNNALLSC
jgi:hypothetical protein